MEEGVVLLAMLGDGSGDGHLTARAPMHHWTAHSRRRLHRLCRRHYSIHSRGKGRDNGSGAGLRGREGRGGRRHPR